MAEVKWIKITTDIFDDEKILLIESLPDAYAIITCWFKLLCLAGKQNNSGVFLMGKIAYTDKMLATIFRMKEATVTMALQVFQEFGMVEIIDGVITIPNWGKHQNLEQLEAKKEYMREYMKEYRRKQHTLAAPGEESKTESKSNGKTNSKTNVSSLDIERDKEGDSEGERESTAAEPPAPAPRTAPEKHKYGSYGWVRLTDDQYAKLVKDLGQAEVDRCIAYVDESAQSNGNKNRWKDWNLVIRKCNREGWGRKNGYAQRGNTGFETSNPFLEMLNERRGGG